MAAAESILNQINYSNYTNGITLIYKPGLGYSGFITTLRLTVNLNSIAEATFPYIPDDTPPAVLQEILNEVALNTEFKEIVLFFKKGTGAWMERCPLKVFNKEPFYDVNLMHLFSDANTIDVAEDFSLGIQVKVGNVLANTDTILVWGSVVEEKKNNGNEELAARLEALELALSGRLTNLSANTLLGRNAGTGLVEQIPQSDFVSSFSLANKADLVNGTVPGSQLPGFVDDILELAMLANFPPAGESGKLYVAANTNLVYRWSGTTYVAISDSLALGITSASAHRGDLGNIAYNHSQSSGNPHNVTKSEIGLGLLTNALQLVATNDLNDLNNRQIALNNLAGGVTANKFLAGNGTNVVMRQVDLATPDITGILPIASGGTGIGVSNTFKVAASALQAVPNGTWTKIIFNSEIADSNNQVANGRLTALTTETWRFTVYVTFRVTANTRVLLSIFKNGAEVGGTSRILDAVVNTGDFGIPQNVFEFPLVNGDYLEIYCYTSPGCNIFGDSSLNTVFWSGKRVM